MTDSLNEKIGRLRIVRESVSRRSDLYSDMGKLDDKKTAQSMHALNHASAPGKKMQKLGFILIWIPEPTGVTIAAGAPMVLAGRYFDKKYNGATLKDIGQSTRETISSINQFTTSF
ncbi:MAG: hypothetical protein O3C04_00810 [Crenarchaeota archaeon]|nr:hypothetical protein [Thermoproteota archaeon]MDA1124172.1 hypothetical protein [Thermoproteota archaeon]